MSIASLFRKRPPEDYEYAPPPLEPYEREAEPERVPIAWPEKPAELVRSAAVQDWTRSIPIAPPAEFVDLTADQPPTVPMTDASPSHAGLYWSASPGAEGVRLVAVQLFGNRLCIHTRRGDSSTWVSADTLRRSWSIQAIPIPEGMPLEAFAS